MKDKNTYTEKFVSEEKRLIFSAYIVQMRKFGYTVEAIGQGVAMLEWSLDNLDDITEFD